MSTIGHDELAMQLADVIYNNVRESIKDAHGHDGAVFTGAAWATIEHLKKLGLLQAPPAALAVPEAAALVQKWREQANAALRRSGTWNGNDMADRIERMADELAAMLAAANKENSNG